jgi:hypothetical protein
MQTCILLGLWQCSLNGEHQHFRTSCIHLHPCTSVTIHWFMGETQLHLLIFRQISRFRRTMENIFLGHRYATKKDNKKQKNKHILNTYNGVARRIFVIPQFAELNIVINQDLVLKPHNYYMLFFKFQNLQPIRNHMVHTVWNWPTQHVKHTCFAQCTLF